MSIAVVASESPRVQGAFNFRDLGGLPLTDGRRVRLGRLYRSDTLQALTSEDVDYLHDSCGVRTVVDLRLSNEVSEQGCGLLSGCADVDFINSPLEMASTEGIAPDQVLDTLYARCLASESLPRAIASIAKHADRPTLVHCAAGKDRTGIVVAIVLSLIGVDKAAIVADYMLSRAAMPRMIERFMSWPRYREHLVAMPPEVYAVEEGPIRRLLTNLDVEHQGVRQWAERSGISAETVDRLERHLISEA